MVHSIRRIVPAMVLAAGAVALAGAAAHAFEPLPAVPPVPAGNAMSAAKVELGKQLFFDPRISSTGTVSCNSCHNVMEGGDDDRATSMGVHGETGPRNAPTVWNAAYLSVQFWDGRAPSLEEQAKGPIVNPIEMGMPEHRASLDRIREIPGYVRQFQAVFGGESPVNIENAVAAIATYERTLITPNGPFDRFLRGDEDAISAQAKAGMKLFQETGCTACHSGSNFAGPPLPEGTGFYQKFPTYPDNDYVDEYDLDDDEGRYEATGDKKDKHMFRVPTLRNIELTAPYFHNGKVETLDEAVRVMAKTQLNKELKDDEVAKIVAFLKTLTGEFPAQVMPRLPGKPGATVVESE